MADLLERLKAALAGGYTIERELGSGGMATVYLAQDLKHERQVAVKVLRPELAAALGPERFHQEIKIAANLTHPHILPLHDSGDADGFLYYVMPHVEGESLRDKLAKEGELPIAQAVRILRDVVDALSEAHEKGVVHRDIKPDNVLLTKHHALVTDFGVAKAVSEATGVHKLTTEGVALGTPAYMSPEQAAADKHIDHRADIYAVGVLAYELLTGRPPFTGTTPQEVLSAQVTQAPEPVTKYRAAVPPALAQVVMKCLEKKAADRWQSAEELLPQLEALATPSGGITPAETKPVTAVQRVSRRMWLGVGATVVVLAVAATSVLLLTQQSAPLVEDRVVVSSLENQTGDASLDVVGLWAADWITQGLQASGLVDVVPSPTASQSSRFVRELVAEGRASDPIHALAEETRAGIVVSGAFYRLGDSVEFQVQITDARRGELMHAIDPISAPFDSPQEGVESVRQRVIGALAASLDERLAEMTGFANTIPTFEAYQQYSEGMEAYLARGYRAGLPYFYRAMELDSTFSSPLLFAVYAHSNVSEWAEEDSLLGVAERRRDQLTPYERYLFDAMRSSLNGDREASYGAARRAAELAPGSRAVYTWAREARRANRPREAVGALEQLDPERGAMRGWVSYWDELTDALHMLGKHKRELEAARRAREQYPNSMFVLHLEVYALGALGDVAEVEDRLEAARGLSPRGDHTLGSLLFSAGGELRAHGHPEVGMQLMEQALDWYEVDEGSDSLASSTHIFLLYYTNRLDEAERRIRAWLEVPDYPVSRLGLLGGIAARRGDSEGALRISESLRDLGRPYLRGQHTLQRAHVAAELGDLEVAVRLLQQALSEGYSYSSALSSFVYWDPLRDYPPFQELLRPKG